MALLQTGDIAGKKTVTSTKSTDLVPIVQDKTIKNISPTNLILGLNGTNVGGVATGSFSKTSNTTLSNITGLSVTLTAGGIYVFNGYLATTNNGTGGIKLATSGTATATTFLCDVWVYNTTTLTGEGNFTALGTLTNAAIAATAVEIGGSITVNAGGTFILQAAQNTSNGTALTVANGSYIAFNRIG